MSDAWIREDRPPDYRGNFYGSVLLRWAMWPARAAFDFSPFKGYERAPLDTWPVQVLYGGPVEDARVLDTPQGDAFLAAMNAWLAAQGKQGYLTRVPLAPPHLGVTWPHRGWQWWYATEYRPRERYKVAYRDGLPDRYVLA